MKRTLIVDMDGTISVCGRYYNAANQKVAELVSKEYAVDPALARELIEFLDVWAIKASADRGFMRERYPRSTAAAVAAAGAVMTGDLHHHHVYAAYKTADDVFDAPYELFDGAKDTLKRYREAGWQVVVYTKGDPEVQQRKYDQNGLADVTDGIHIVPKKNVAALKAFCEQWQVDTLSSVYVGDSVRDDMRPANELGIFAVRITAQPEDVWIHDKTEDLVSDRVIPALANLKDVVALYEFENPDRELCANCGKVWDAHIGNLGNPFPCWMPSGKYDDGNRS